MNAITVVEKGAFPGNLPLITGPNAQVICQTDGESTKEFAGRVMKRTTRLATPGQVKSIKYFFSGEAGIESQLARQRAASALVRTLGGDQPARMTFYVQPEPDAQADVLMLIDELRHELVREHQGHRVEFSLQSVSPPVRECAVPSSKRPVAVVSTKRWTPAETSSRELRISA